MFKAKSSINIWFSKCYRRNVLNSKRDAARVLGGVPNYQTAEAVIKGHKDHVDSEGTAVTIPENTFGKRVITGENYVWRDDAWRCDSIRAQRLFIGIW